MKRISIKTVDGSRHDHENVHRHGIDSIGGEPFLVFSINDVVDGGIIYYNIKNIVTIIEVEHE